MDERSPTVSAQAPAPAGLWNRLVRKARIARRRGRRDGERGATMLEWVLLVAAIALPSYAIIVLGLRDAVCPLPVGHDPQRPAVPLTRPRVAAPNRPAHPPAPNPLPGRCDVPPNLP